MDKTKWNELSDMQHNIWTFSNHGKRAKTNPILKKVFWDKLSVSCETWHEKKTT